MNLKQLTKSLTVKSNPITQLESVAVAPNPKKVNTKHTRWLLNQLGPYNSKLIMLEGRVIDMNQRLTFFKDTFSTYEEKVSSYAFHLGVVMSVTPLSGRRYLPADLEFKGPQSQFDCSQVVQLLRLSKLGLPDSAFGSELQEFSCLEVLNLSDNKITSIEELGVTKLPSLVWLDLRNNKIDTPHEKLGEIIDGMCWFVGLLV